MKLAAALLALAPLALAQADRQALDLAHFDAKLLDFRDKQIILLGESHGIAVNEDLDLALLQGEGSVAWTKERRELGAPPGRRPCRTC